MMIERRRDVHRTDACASSWVVLPEPVSVTWSASSGYELPSECLPHARVVYTAPSMRCSVPSPSQNGPRRRRSSLRRRSMPWPRQHREVSNLQGLRPRQAQGGQRRCPRPAYREDRRGPKVRSAYRFPRALDRRWPLRCGDRPHRLKRGCSGWQDTTPPHPRGEGKGCGKDRRLLWGRYVLTRGHQSVTLPRKGPDGTVLCVDGRITVSPCVFHGPSEPPNTRWGVPTTGSWGWSWCCRDASAASSRVPR